MTTLTLNRQSTATTTATTTETAPARTRPPLARRTAQAVALPALLAGLLLSLLGYLAVAAAAVLLLGTVVG